MDWRGNIEPYQSTLRSLIAENPKIGPDVRRALTPEGSIAARNHIGGTAPAQVRAAVIRARKRLAAAD